MSQNILALNLWLSEFNKRLWSLEKIFANVTQQQHKLENKPEQKTKYILSSAASLWGGECMSMGKHTDGFMEISISSAQGVHTAWPQKSKKERIYAE